MQQWQHHTTWKGDSLGDSLGIPGGLARILGGLALKQGCFSLGFGGTRSRPHRSFYNIKKGWGVDGWVTSLPASAHF